MPNRLWNAVGSARRLTVVLALLALPLLGACRDDLTQKVNDNADDYDNGVKADKQYDEQQDKTTNCQPQSSLQVPSGIILADWIGSPAGEQLAWGSGGGGSGSGGGSGGKDRPKNCP